MIDPWAAGLAALLPLAAPGLAQPAPAQAFVAPSGPLVLTRVLRRPLPDGAEIVSTRRYEVRIRAEGEGFLVEGRLIGAEVAAPPSLAALAALERNRPDSGLFPFRLDAKGLIASAAAPTDLAPGQAAAASARVVIAGSALGEPDRDEAQAMIDQLMARGSAGGARWPSDLFRPAPGLRSQTSRFALPDGQKGSVTTTVDARSDGAGGSIERTIITETGGVQRVTREVWSISPRHG